MVFQLVDYSRQTHDQQAGVECLHGPEPPAMMVSNWRDDSHTESSEAQIPEANAFTL